MTVGPDLARLYDLDVAQGPGDLGLYLALAHRTGGPVLELAAGTGRLAVPLAVSGFEVVAVDRDPGMLERARARWSREAASRAPGSAEALRLVEADLFDLRLGARFGLAILALNSCFLLGDAARQAEVLAVMSRHLRPGGLAVVDAWIPGADDLAIYDGRAVLEWVRDDPETGLRVSKLGSASYDPATRSVELTAIFDAAPPDGGPIVRHVRQDVVHLISESELVRAAIDAGLVVEQVGGDYDLEPFGPGSERAVLVATLPQAVAVDAAAATRNKAAHEDTTGRARAGAGLV